MTQRFEPRKLTPAERDELNGKIRTLREMLTEPGDEDQLTAAELHWLREYGQLPKERG